MTNAIIIAVVAIIVGAAVWYIIKEKKQGKCVGCPNSKVCGSKCSGGCSGCAGHE